ncbi:MAG: alkaline phosphatase family protein [Actinomycetes bacterium]
MSRPRGVLLVLDGLPHRHCNKRITPNLMRLAAEGGMAPDGGRAVLTSATYPNHASLVTAVAPDRHGIFANFVVRNEQIVAAETVGPQALTLFDLDVESAAVYGDQNLVGVTGATIATTHWPPNGVIPDDAVRTTDGYVANESTIEHLLLALQSDAQLVVAQLNDPDTAGHLYGPDTDEAAAVYHATDADVAVIVEMLRSQWDDTMLVIVSDHDQIAVTNPDCIDLWSPLRERGLPLTVVPEGDAAVIIGDDPTNGRWLDAIVGVAGHERWHEGSRIAWAEPGRVFGWGAATLKGIHGGPWTRTQVAVVTGGHRQVATVADAISGRPPRVTLWPRVLARLVDRAL